MNMTMMRVRRLALCPVAALGLVAVCAVPANAAAVVSQATAQAVNLHLLTNALTLAVSNPATAATNDGTGTNAEIDKAPLISLLSGESFVEAGALTEAAEANTDGSSYGCAGVASPGGGIQVGNQGTTCTPTGNGTGGVTIDLGKLPGLGAGLLLAGGDIKITIDAITAHGQVSGTGPATLGAAVANIRVQLGNAAPLSVPISANPNQDLLSAVLAVLSPQLGALGTRVSNLLKGVVELTTNYQPAPEPNASGTYSVTGLHISLLNNALATADLARVTVGPNVPTAPGAAFSFQDLPLILGGLALLIALGFGARIGVRRLQHAA
jgi:hypothetical protein